MVSAPTKPPLAPTIVPGASTTLRLPAEWKLTPDCLIELAALNEALFFERTAEGALVITGPPGNLSSKRGFAIGLQIGNWALARDSGDVGAADEGYELPDSSVRTPDFSWVSGEPIPRCEPLISPGSQASAWPRSRSAMKASGGFVQTSCLKSARAARAFPNSSARWSAGWPTVSDLAGSWMRSQTASGSTAKASPSLNGWSAR